MNKARFEISNPGAVRAQLRELLDPDRRANELVLVPEWGGLLLSQRDLRSIRADESVVLPPSLRARGE